MTKGEKARVMRLIFISAAIVFRITVKNAQKNFEAKKVHFL